MKHYFIQLLNYDKFENHAILDVILTANKSEKAVQLMAHLLAAQQRWLSRCVDNYVGGDVLWPDWPAESLGKIIDDNHQRWVNYLNTLNTEDFNNIIAYKTSQGVPYEDKLSDILAHLINHGTHHRAQIGQQLKFAGVEQIPMTDLIFYIRQNQ